MGVGVTSAHKKKETGIVSISSRCESNLFLTPYDRIVAVCDIYHLDRYLPR